MADSTLKTGDGTTTTLKVGDVVPESNGNDGGVVITADTVTIPDPTPHSPKSSFSAEDIAKARQEEKDKLYSRLAKQDEAFKAVQTELEEMRKARETAAEAEVRARREAEEATKKQREEEMSAKDLLAVKEQEWRERLDRIEDERKQERVLLEKERQFTSMQAYITRRANEERENIAPQLIDLVNGNTQEEVEASIESLKKRTDAILDSVRAATEAAAQQARSTLRGVPPTGYPPVGPMDTESGKKTYTAEELRDMPMEKWAQIRGKILPSLSKSSQGLFG